MLIDIGVVAERSGVSPATLRYYEDIGLIRSEARHGLRRQFGPETLTQLSLIALGKLAGFSLQEIKGMFGEDGTAELPRNVLRERATEIDAQIRNMTTLRDALRHVADCPADSHMACPKFRRIVGMAAHVQRRRAGR